MSIIVGDVHGNVEKVKVFLAYKPEIEHVALGDYVDSFTEPVDRQVQALQLLLDSDAVLIWGNHDLHYLATPPFICTGYQYKDEQVYRALIEANKGRFKAAHVADGWLCTHAGVNDRLSKSENESAIADRLNREMEEYLDRPHEPGPQSIFAIGRGRGGQSSCGGIFWFDFKREYGLDLSIKQIFGHTETPEPVINDHDVPKSNVALDTTNNKDTVYLFDTQAEALVEQPMPKREKRNSNTLHPFPRLRDLPEEEREPFWQWLMGQTRPMVGGLPVEEQDFYYGDDYLKWKSYLLNQPQRLRDLGRTRVI